MNKQTESYVSLFAGFTSRSFSAARRAGPSESEGRQEKCGSEVVIKGKTEGVRREIRVDEERLSFNRGKR